MGDRQKQQQTEETFPKMSTFIQKGNHLDW